jgi:hypothetical protein
LNLSPRRGGFNPSELFFNLVVTRPTGFVQQLQVDETLKHIEPVSRDANYTKIHIFFEDKEWSVPVEQAS